MWQSPPLCSELLSQLGQSLKVSPINGKEHSRLTQTVIQLALNVRAEILSVYWLKLPQKEREREGKDPEDTLVFTYFSYSQIETNREKKYIHASFCIIQWQQSCSDWFSSHSEKKRKEKHVESNSSKMCTCSYKLFTFNVSCKVCQVGGR